MPRKKFSDPYPVRLRFSQKERIETIHENTGYDRSEILRELLQIGLDNINKDTIKEPDKNQVQLD